MVKITTTTECHEYQYEWNVAKKIWAQPREREAWRTLLPNTHSTSIYIRCGMVSFVNWNTRTCVCVSTSFLGRFNRIWILTLTKNLISNFRLNQQNSKIIKPHSFARVPPSASIDTVLMCVSVRMADKWTGCETLKLSLNERYNRYESFLHAIPESCTFEHLPSMPIRMKWTRNIL